MIGVHFCGLTATLEPFVVKGAEKVAPHYYYPG
jgi:hypothetical protein